MLDFTLPTPCLTLNKTLLGQNIQRMQTEVNQAGKHLRPHVKTHKCPELAKRQIAAGAIGICVTKVSEARVMVEQGIGNILITSPVVTTAKLEQLALCHKCDPDLLVVCDSMDNARQLNAMATHPLNVLVDIDPGVGRTGVAYANALALGLFIDQHCPQLRLQGIQCYAGNLQHIVSYEERKTASLVVLTKAAAVKQQFLDNGLCCDIMTGSGTGTYEMDMTLDAVTEVQPGSYTVMDREYHNIGSSDDAHTFTRFNPAMLLCTTVISANHDTHATVDVGTKALYFDAHTRPKIVSHPGLQYDWSVFGDEHGKVTADPGVPLPKVGEVLQMVVPHCDPTINLHNIFYVIENGQVVDQWPIAARGCVA